MDTNLSSAQADDALHGVHPQARLIAVCSLKGGVGKSTSVVQIAAALTKLHKTVLLVDADANCSASHLCGFENTDEVAGTVAAVIMRGQPLSDAVQPVLPRWDILRGTTALRLLETYADIDDPEIAGPDGHLNDLALRQALVPALAAYDYILIDCAGGHPKIIRMALMAADEVIVPTGMSLVDLNGTVPTLDLVIQAQVARQEDGLPTFLGFLPNGTDKAGVPAKLKALLAEYHYPCFSPIRSSTTLRSGPRSTKRLESRFLVLSRPGLPAALSYQQVAGEIEYGIGHVPPVPASASASATDSGELEAQDGQEAETVSGQTETVLLRPLVEPDLSGEIAMAADQQPAVPGPVYSAQTVDSF